ncbi:MULTISPECIES: hypothetical protein [Prochlorococcus]|uniref:hypothetical protein n=1 Tax=Prochlorococcus TaxID=1218 RepID=UPI0005339BBD|nr:MULTISPECIES: hypothetical protein [Prochlorococcus]KGG12784.1 hypothetical protein EV05_0455 [Prochlorococcus sp. MIT 0601]
MTPNKFDVIIDDLFLDGAARIRSFKYYNKINPRAVKIISDFCDEEKKNLRAA